jgi:hypothetical protein
VLIYSNAFRAVARNNATQLRYLLPFGSDSVALVKSSNENEASNDRLRRFAETYIAKMKAKPYIEISTRYASMTEAGLSVSEREKAEIFIDAGKIDHLLHPEDHTAAVITINE